MPLLFDFLYAFALLPAVPFLAVKSRRTGKYRSDWGARLGMGPDLPRLGGGKTLLLHCVSVGELLSVQTLIARLLEASPALRIAITTTTDTGTERARTMFAHHPRVSALRFPLDFSFAVESLFDRVRPDAIALVELETWPNFLEIARDRRIPVVLINGRLSERSFPRYRLIRPVMGSMLRKLAWMGVQTERIAERFRALGAPAERMQVLPTLKYDNAQFGTPVPGQETLAQAMGLAVGEAGAGHQLLVAGSTGPGEENAILDAYLELRGKHAGLRLAIAPRKPESLPGLLEALKSRGLTPILRTARPDGACGELLGPSSVFVLDTLGELKKLYALAFAVFVGRSLVKMGGSDMIEAAALAKPCCFGPYTNNFAEVVELLLQKKTAVEVRDGEGLKRTVEAWLESPAEARRMGERARDMMMSQRGSTEQYVAKLLEVVGERGRLAGVP